MYPVGRAINHTTTVEGPQKLKIELPSGPAVLHLGTQPKDSVNMHDHCCFVTTARTWDQPSFTKTCMRKMHPTDIIEIYSAIKKNRDLCRKKKWIKLTSIMIQHKPTHKDRCLLFSLI